MKNRPADFGEASYLANHNHSDIEITDNFLILITKIRKLYNIAIEGKTDEQIFADWLENRLQLCRSDSAKRLQESNTNLLDCISKNEIESGIILTKIAITTLKVILYEAYGSPRNITCPSKCALVLFEKDFCLEAAENICLNEGFLKLLGLFRKKTCEKTDKFSDKAIIVLWLMSHLKHSDSLRTKNMLLIVKLQVLKSIDFAMGNNEILLTGVSALMLKEVLDKHYNNAVRMGDYTNYAYWLFEQDFNLKADSKVGDDCVDLEGIN